MNILYVLEGLGLLYCWCEYGKNVVKYFTPLGKEGG